MKHELSLFDILIVYFRMNWSHKTLNRLKNKTE